VRCERAAGFADLAADFFDDLGIESAHLAATARGVAHA
jgi:hypothetical protein